MERIALISDIHANLHALNQFLNYVNQKCPVSKILNMGDFIQIGPNPAEVFDLVTHDERFVNIQGNSEAMYFNDNLREQYRNEAAHQAWTAKQLGTERMEKLRQFPLTTTVEVGGKKFLMVHARPERPADTPLLYSGHTFPEFLADYGTEADCVLIGHTHLPLYAIHWNNRPILNPGSIGCGKDGIARFIIIELDNGQMDIAYKHLRYPKEKVLRDYEQNHVPCREKFIAMFY